MIQAQADRPIANNPSKTRGDKNVAVKKLTMDFIEVASAIPIRWTVCLIARAPKEFKTT
jgi:hypothetical protein